VRLVHQLFSAVGFALLGASAAGLFGVLQVREAAATYEHLVEVDDVQARQAADALVAFKNQVQNGKDILLRGSDPARLDKYWTGFQKYEQAAQAITEKLAADLPPGETRSKVERFNLLHKQMGQAYRQALDAFKRSGFDVAVGDKAMDGLDREPAILLRESGAGIIEQASAAAARAKEAERRAIVLSIAAVALTLLVGMVGALLFARSVTRKLGGEPDDARAAANEVAMGNLRVELRLRAGDTDSLLAALRTMAHSLAGIVGRVRQGSDSIATGSAQIALGNADLSERTEEQARALQQIASSMDQLGAMVRQNAGHARDASQLADGASAIALEGGQVVGRVVETMQGINDSSRRIADIIGMIDGIAFQTNVLALNAAVEAARAGEQGRGFAVVATEVRNLAQRSASAAKEIAALISDSVERVSGGARLVEQAGSTMTQIVGAVERVTAVVGEISRASAEQELGVGDVGEALARMDQTTQQNAALVEESAAAAESLRQQAAALVDCVAQFRL
jgi:methyl-accepting chemotaxis protein